jgi:hypothetical protein
MGSFGDRELGDVGDRIRMERRELSELQLDQVKQRALAQASRPRRRSLRLRSRRGLAVVLATAIVGSGGAAVYAALPGLPSILSSANKQYCPPTSPGGGKPKPHQKPGNKCGHHP